MVTSFNAWRIFYVSGYIAGKKDSTDDIPSTQPLFEHEVRELVETMRNLSPMNFGR